MALILALSNSFILATKILKNPTLHTIYYLREILVTVICFLEPYFAKQRLILPAQQS